MLMDGMHFVEILVDAEGNHNVKSYEEFFAAVKEGRPTVLFYPVNGGADNVTLCEYEGYYTNMALVNTADAKAIWLTEKLKNMKVETRPLFC